jgi:hypothetical protein
VVTFAVWALAALGGVLGVAASRPGEPAAMLTWLALLGYCVTVAVLAARCPPPPHQPIRDAESVGSA